MTDEELASKEPCGLASSLCSICTNRWTHIYYWGDGTSHGDCPKCQAAKSVMVMDLTMFKPFGPLPMPKKHDTEPSP